MAAKEFRNGTFRGNIEWFCSIDDIFISVKESIFTDERTRMPHCLDADGNNVETIENTKINGFNKEFLQKYVILKEPLPDHFLI